MTPTMLYKTPGPHDIHGGKFDYIIVDSDDEQALGDAIRSGWRLTTAAALELAAEAANDNAPPTREELEAKATELGLKFDGRTSDKKLGELISTALKVE